MKILDFRQHSALTPCRTLGICQLCLWIVLLRASSAASGVFVKADAFDVVPRCCLMAEEALVDLGIRLSADRLIDHLKVHHVVARRGLNPTHSRTSRGTPAACRRLAGGRASAASDHPREPSHTSHAPRLGRRKMHAHDTQNFLATPHHSRTRSRAWKN